jgi:hypothetical protein
MTTYEVEPIERLPHPAVNFMIVCVIAGAFVWGLTIGFHWGQDLAAEKIKANTEEKK